MILHDRLFSRTSGKRPSATHRSGLGQVLAMLVAMTACSESHAVCSLSGSSSEWCFEQGVVANTGSPETDDLLGAAVAVGDFNGDGNLDLAVGAPGENGGLGDGDGVVHILYGDGLFPRALLTPTLLSNDEPNGRFGAALAADDFDGDGIDDLAVGAPSENFEGIFPGCGFDTVCDNAGRVHVYLGQLSGLSTSDSADFGPRNCSAPLTGDNRLFGTSLAVQRFNTQGRLVVGVPGEGDTLEPQGGGVCSFVYDRNGPLDLFDAASTFASGFSGETEDFSAHYGERVVAAGFSNDRVFQLAFSGPLADLASTSDTGSVILANSTFEENRFLQTDWPPAGSAADDHFGTGLAAGDFNGDGRADLAIGTPLKDAGSGNPSNSGRIYIAEGDPAEILVPGQLFGQGNLPTQTSEADDNFGFALAAGSLDLDGFDDLIVGVPGEESGAGDSNTGFVNILHGTATGLTAVGAQSFRQGDIGGSNDPNSRFGSVLATADFNSDGVDEIIIGVPSRTVSGQSRGGRVYIARQFSATGGHADIALTFTGPTAPGAVSPGAAVSDRIVISHLGSVASISNLSVHVVYPAGTLPGTTPFDGGLWNCAVETTASALTYDCSSEQTVAEGAATAILTLNVKVATNAGGATFTRTASASSPINDPTLANNSRTLSATLLLPDLTVTKTRMGAEFFQGESLRSYVVTVTNSGAGGKPAQALVTLLDTAPAGISITSMSGVGWACNVSQPTCGRFDVLPAGQSYPPLFVIVSVASDASSPQVNTVSVTTAANESNGANNIGTDSSVVLLSPDLTVSKSHLGNFTQGQVAATYRVTVTNSGAGTKLGDKLVTLTDAAPAGLSVTAMTGSGWTCTALPVCTRDDELLGGQSYSPITVTVTVAADATSPLINTVSVTSSQVETSNVNNSAFDSTVIEQPDGVFQSSFE